MVPALMLVLHAPAAHAWGTREHREIGAEAYTAACKQIAAEVDLKSSTDPALAARYEEACGHLEAKARIYGQANAIAGDYLGGPEDFMTHRGALNVVSRLHYYDLARGNFDHFHPAVTRLWREVHDQAVEHALAAAQTKGLAQSIEFERAFYENAYADHFLQDSFAAGHMGFNRTASSASAGLLFHNRWNAHGRWALDRKGSRWLTYGDSRLDDPRNVDGRRHVCHAATASVHAFLATFVRGERVSEEDDLEAWRSLPYMIEAPELKPAVVELFTGEEEEPTKPELVPLLAMMRPARVDEQVEAWGWSAGSFGAPRKPFVGLLAALDFGIPGPVSFPLESYLAVGATVYQPNGEHRFIMDLGLDLPIELSTGGVIAHHVKGGLTWIVQGSFTAVAHAEYQITAHLGATLIFLEAGPSLLFPGDRIGWYAGVGVGQVLGASGGGVF
jgi:hypothetical protein